ncbi:hypothetical protein [Streptomyces lydicamycinicus]|uniref:hypothetical protein n=1 Tax=Streptomyces lydicamycinicus TaxID=1546107 RepID=UPI003C2F5540
MRAAPVDAAGLLGAEGKADGYGGQQLTAGAPVGWVLEIPGGGEPIACFGDGVGEVSGFGDDTCAFAGVCSEAGEVERHQAVEDEEE